MLLFKLVRITEKLPVFPGGWGEDAGVQEDRDSSVTTGGAVQGPILILGLLLSAGASPGFCLLVRTQGWTVCTFGYNPGVQGTTESEAGRRSNM